MQRPPEKKGKKNPNKTKMSRHFHILHSCCVREADRFRAQLKKKDKHEADGGFPALRDGGQPRQADDGTLFNRKYKERPFRKSQLSAPHRDTIRFAPPVSVSLFVIRSSSVPKLTEPKGGGAEL